MLTFKKTQDPPVAELVRTDPETNKEKRKRVYHTFSPTHDKDAVKHMDFRDEPNTIVKYVPQLIKGQRYSCFISGGSGSGKSSRAAEIIRQLQRAYPEKKCYVFSSVQTFNDPAFKRLDLKHIRAKPDKLGVYMSLEMEHLADSIILWDDFLSDQRDEVNTKTLKLLNSCLELGRKLGINCVVINHHSRDYHRTRTVIAESPVWVLFPVTNSHATSRLLKEYGDFNKSDLEAIKGVQEGRFTTVYVSVGIPRFWMSSKQIKVLE